MTTMTKMSLPLGSGFKLFSTKRLEVEKAIRVLIVIESSVVNVFLPLFHSTKASEATALAMRLAQSDTRKAPTDFINFHISMTMLSPNVCLAGEAVKSASGG
jgi:hypothetical protein